MDRIVRARFYQVESMEEGALSFRDCLLRLWHHDRRAIYQDIGYGALVRIERCAPDVDDADFYFGEFVRQQTDNIPPVAVAGAPLIGNDNPLGHRCAFRFHAPTMTLLIEAKREAVTIGRLNSLIKSRVQGHRGFLISPSLTQDALERLRNGTPRKISMRVARPVEAFGENPRDPLENNIAGLQNIFGGPSIEVSSGWPQGDRNGVLNLGAIRDVLRWGDEHRANVRRLEGKIAEEPEPIDVFSEQMKLEQTLDLDSQDVERNYTVRESFLEEGFRVRMPEIERLYGQR